MLPDTRNVRQTAPAHHPSKGTPPKSASSCHLAPPEAEPAAHQHRHAVSTGHACPCSLFGTSYAHATTSKVCLACGGVPAVSLTWLLLGFSGAPPSTGRRHCRTRLCTRWLLPSAARRSMSPVLLRVCHAAWKNGHAGPSLNRSALVQATPGMSGLSSSTRGPW
jgi:hypothetical protein